MLANGTTRRSAMLPRTSRCSNGSVRLISAVTAALAMGTPSTTRRARAVARPSVPGRNGGIPSAVIGALVGRALLRLSLRDVARDLDCAHPPLRGGRDPGSHRGKVRAQAHPERRDRHLAAGALER